MEKLKKYKVTNGRFAMGENSYEYGQVVELNASDEKKLKKEGIIGDCLEEFVEVEEIEEEPETTKTKTETTKTKTKTKAKVEIPTN